MVNSFLYYSTPVKGLHRMKYISVWEARMVQVTLLLDPTVALFYTNISKQANIPLEQVLADALFKLAGELSLEALQGN